MLCFFTSDERKICSTIKKSQNTIMIAVCYFARGISVFCKNFQKFLCDLLLRRDLSCCAPAMKFLEKHLKELIFTEVASLQPATSLKIP